MLHKYRTCLLDSGARVEPTGPTRTYGDLIEDHTEKSRILGSLVARGIEDLGNALRPAEREKIFRRGNDIRIAGNA